MEFLLIVLALSFVIQLLVLSATEQLSLRLLGAALMEMIPVSGMIYYTAARPDGLLFGWGGKKGTATDYITQLASAAQLRRAESNLL